jgi:AraC-like DNA-binding protein
MYLAYSYSTGLTKDEKIEIDKQIKQRRGELHFYLSLACTVNVILIRFYIKKIAEELELIRTTLVNLLVLAGY